MTNNHKANESKGMVMSVSSVQTGLFLPNNTAYTPVAPAVTFVFFLGGDSRKVKFLSYVQEGETEKGERGKLFGWWSDGRGG